MTADVLLSASRLAIATRTSGRGGGPSLVLRDSGSLDLVLNGPVFFRAVADGVGTKVGRPEGCEDPRTVEQSSSTGEKDTVATGDLLGTWEVSD